jgi:replicative DNA helicase
MLRQWIEHREVDKNLFDWKEYPGISEVFETIDDYSLPLLEHLKNLWLDRKYYELFDNTRHIEKPKERLDLVRRMIAETELKTTEFYSQEEETNRLIDIIAANQLGNKTILGYRTGIDRLDTAINGIEKGKMYLIGGLKKTGKSRLMIFLANNLMLQGARILMNSLEMNASQLNAVSLSYMSGVDSSRIGGCATSAENETIQARFNELKNLNWCIYREYTPEALLSRLEFEKTKKPVDVLFVDFAQRMRVPHLKNDRVREVEFVAQRLADISREQNVAVILLSQLSGLAEHLKEDEIPNMSHYKESQALPENADCILTLHNPKRNEPAFNQDAYIIQDMFLKVEQRYGLSGITLQLSADLRTAKFEYSKVS